MALKTEIEAANLKFMSYYNNGNMESLSSLYTPDCKIMPTGEDVMEGRDAVQAVFQSVITAGGTNVTLTVDEVGPLGGPGMELEMAFERSHYEFKTAQGAVFDHGKYVVIWKKVEGKWMLYTDIFNTNAKS